MKLLSLILIVSSIALYAQPSGQSFLSDIQPTDSNDIIQSILPKNPNSRNHDAPGDTNNLTRKPKRKQSNPHIIDDCIEAHNYYRHVHGVPKLIRDERIVDWATNRSREIVVDFGLSINCTFGENMIMTTKQNETCHDLVGTWYNEIKKYDFDNPNFVPTAGHFSQLVWNSTTTIGCGYNSVSNGTYLVCGYYPPGNVLGSFEQNVNKPKMSITTTKSPKIAKPKQTKAPPLELNANEMKIQVDCLKAHNKYRSRHNVTQMTLDQSVIDWAKKRSKEIAINFAHKPNPPFGENLAMISRKNANCADLVAMWYDEIDNYNYDLGQYNETTGHFTQLVWKKSTQIGCGYYVNEDGTFLSCGYKPHGNIIGAFKENVLPRMDQT